MASTILRRERPSKPPPNSPSSPEPTLRDYIRDRTRMYKKERGIGVFR